MIDAYIDTVVPECPKYAEYFWQVGSVLVAAEPPPLDPPPHAARARVTLSAPAARADPRRHVCTPMAVLSIDAPEHRHSGCVSRDM
jgi:hypothetical protein